MKWRRMGRGAGGIAISAALAVFPASGRKHPPAATENPGVLKVTTHLVQVSVIVKDRHGRAVPGLTQNDFTIFDDGVEQGISDFEVEQSRAAAAQEKIPPDIFTNIPERAAGNAPAVTVILLDGLNTAWEDQARSTEQVIKFLKQLQPGDRVGLYALGTRLILLHDFTSDSAALVKALDHYRGRRGDELKGSEAGNADNPPEWSDEVNQMAQDIPSAAVANAIQDWMASATNLEARYFMSQRVAMTLEALEAIAGHLRGVPGRKNLIWVSSAFPLLTGMDELEQSGDFSMGSTYEEEFVQAARTVSDANLAVYPVDARGLMGDPNFGVQTGPPNPRAFARMARPRLSSHLTDNFTTMDEMAKRTGGRAFYNTNDIQGSIREVIDDTRLTYLLAYYPTGTVWNGKFHKIKVEVNRPEARLEYRSGYAALAEPPAGPRTTSAEKRLYATVLSPLDATGVAVVVKATAVKAAAGAPEKVIVQYWINPRDITLSPDGQKWAARVTLVIEEFGPRRQVLKGTSHQFNFELTAGQRKQFLAAGLRYNEPLAIVPQTERLRVVVRDDPSGTLGSVSVPLDRVLARNGG